MYAIVNIAGQQFKVEKDQKLFVHRLADKEGDSVSFDEVLLIDNDKSVVVGEPTIKGAAITGKVISHPKGDKVQVFKKKRRKGYKVLRGHRQYLTEIMIQDIIEKGATKDSKPKTATKADLPSEEKVVAKAPAKKATTAAKADAPKKEAVKKDTPAKPAAAKKTTETSAKKPAAKKPAVKKETATKKPAAKKTTASTAKAAPKKPAGGKTDK
ncbi:50S ribosomal protein L21 [Bacteroidota bacterium]